MPARFPFRRNKDDQDEREFLRRRLAEDEQKRVELETQIRKQEREDFLRREREENERLEQKRQQEAEFYRQQQIENQRQEAETRRLNQLRQATPEALRRVRELIRARYELDVYIWNCRGVQKADQEIVIREGTKADAILKEIHDIVDTWEESEWNPKEWEIAKKIKENLQSGEQRVWADNHPWNDRDA